VSCLLRGRQCTRALNVSAQHSASGWRVTQRGIAKLKAYFFTCSQTNQVINAPAVHCLSSAVCFRIHPTIGTTQLTLPPHHKGLTFLSAGIEPLLSMSFFLMIDGWSENFASDLQKVLNMFSGAAKLAVMCKSARKSHGAILEREETVRGCISRALDSSECMNDSGCIVRR
jgi:hypothetical protein